MAYKLPLQEAEALYPEYTFIEALTPSEQKAAFHVQDDKGNHLCLKLIAPDYSMDRLDREILALQSICHPNVAAFKEYTFSSTQGRRRHHIIEEFVVGVDLSVKLVAHHPWPRSEAAVFFAALCDGLSALNEKGIVHRDLKPSNIRVRPDGSPVIIDLGLARHLSLPDITSTADGAAIGTPIYFAPEQFRGTKHDIDHRTDLFALGVLLYQALIGQHPFWQPRMTASLGEAVCNSFDYLAKSRFTRLPTKWQLVLGRLLEKERARRPLNAHQASEILRGIGEL